VPRNFVGERKIHAPFLERAGAMCYINGTFIRQEGDIMATGRDKDRKTRKKHRKNVKRVKALAKARRGGKKGKKG
jgi:hypothetical protein